MFLYRIYGVVNKTGKVTATTITARTITEAREQATESGINVERVILAENEVEYELNEGFKTDKNYLLLEIIHRIRWSVERDMFSQLWAILFC